MINIQEAEKQVNYYLSKTIQNYNLTNREIAQTTGIPEAAISGYVNNTRQPREKNNNTLWNYMYTIWQSGIIKLPPSKHWNGFYYVPVIDIKNPFETWVDNHYCGYATSEFAEWVKEWEKEGKFEIIKLYESFEEFEKKWNHDQSSYNFTEELLQYYPIKEITELKGINFSALAMDLIEKAER